MRTYLDCIPCFVRQSLEAVRFVTDDTRVQELLLREVLREVADMDFHQSPPKMGQWIHRRIRMITGQADPYREVKDKFNSLALELASDLRTTIRCSQCPLETAVRLAIAGNVIDFGINGDLREADVHDTIRQALSEPLHGNIEEFTEAIRSAHSILYLADNAGEIVFDRLLIEHLPTNKVTLAVRGSAVLNDATRIDAEDTGITLLVEVIHNGSDAPGTILEDCSEEFQRCFDAADLIVAKGQGNYESLSDCKKEIFFLLKAKCSVVAQDLKCCVNDLVLQSCCNAESRRN